MKKIFTLFAAALLGLSAYAEVSEYGPCPSKVNFALLNAENPAQVEIELQLVNSSLRKTTMLFNGRKSAERTSLLLVMLLQSLLALRTLPMRSVKNCFSSSAMFNLT